MGVVHNTWIAAAVHGMEAHFIANKDEIQAHHFNSEASARCFGTEKAYCLWTSCLKALKSTQVSIATHKKKLRRAIHNKWRGILSRGVVMIHENARPNTAAATQNHITTFGWEQFDHPLYSPDLAPSDFHLFLHLKSFLAARRFHNDNEVKEAVTTCTA